ncbi:helix-turn-helix transcriptional regulator [Streptomyces sp. NPDC050844]|uniref:helix-turn-helix domain-containing protein n=1 Tax=Streptomyces sp. NPDC050844 TaxID=3155790 RepID=UPI0033CCF700
MTARQKEILAPVANGNTNAQIGRWLGVSSKTVNKHLADICRSLGAHDRAQAVALALALRHGDLTRDDIHEPAKETA